MANKTFQHAARCAQDDVFFLGSALAIYQAGEQIDARELALRLGCAVDTLQRLALCRRPEPGDASFVKDVRCIASWAAVDADHLVDLIRFADAIAALRSAGASSDAGTLLAARDASDDEPAEGPNANGSGEPDGGTPRA